MTNPISFEDYRHDMDELGASAANVAAALKARIDDLQYALWLAVKAAGGEIRVPTELAARHHPTSCVLMRTRSDADHAIIFQACEAKP